MFGRKTDDEGPHERMRYHREHSFPEMKRLKQMRTETLQSKRVEPNSPLWEPLTFIINRWDRLTRFCDVPSLCRARSHHRHRTECGACWPKNWRAHFGFLWGGGTVPDARGRGAYSAIVASRMDFARQRGLSLVGLYARIDTSAPIVAKQGFQRHGRMVYWEGSPSTASACRRSGSTVRSAAGGSRIPGSTG